MALANYTDLKQSVILWSHRGDIDLLVDDFILMVETEMFANPLEVLQIKGQETSDDTLTTTGRVIALPADYQSMRSIRLNINSSGSEVWYSAPEQLKRQHTSGLPRYFTVIGNNIEFDRTPDAVYNIELRYYAKPTPLSTTNATNEVLTKQPNIYLFGCLWATFLFATDEIEAAKYYNQFMGAIKGANKQDKLGRYGPAPAMRIEGATP